MPWKKREDCRGTERKEECDRRERESERKSEWKKRKRHGEREEERDECTIYKVNKIYNSTVIFSCVATTRNKPCLSAVPYKQVHNET